MKYKKQCQHCKGFKFYVEKRPDNTYVYVCVVCGEYLDLKIDRPWHLNRFQVIYDPGLGYVVNRVLYKEDNPEPLVSCVDKIAVFVYELEAEVFCKFRNEMLIKYDSDGAELIEFPLEKH